MPGWELRTPVALLIFNRPETTARVFERVREARPPRLLIVADGPRPGIPDEDRRVREARDVVAAVDWSCEVSTDCSEVNLGCGRRVSSGLDWVFDSVEEAIVLEDDCLPDPSFFRFSEELLDRYRSDDRVMHISGDNFEGVGRSSAARSATAAGDSDCRWGPSYYFSRYPHVWGWAGWRRAWAGYDFEMRRWRDGDRSVLESFEDPGEREFWSRTWDEVVRGEIDTWDYQWTFACLSRGGLSVMPRTNLIANLGFGEGGHHTTDAANPFAEIPARPMRFPLRQPGSVERDPRRTATRRAGLRQARRLSRGPPTASPTVVSFPLPTSITGMSRISSSCSRCPDVSVNRPSAPRAWRNLLATYASSADRSGRSPSTSADEEGVAARPVAADERVALPVREPGKRREGGTEVEPGLMRLGAVEPGVVGNRDLRRRPEEAVVFDHQDPRVRPASIASRTQ